MKKLKTIKSLQRENTELRSALDEANSILYDYQKTVDRYVDNIVVSEKKLEHIKTKHRKDLLVIGLSLAAAALGLIFIIKFLI